MNNTSSSVDKLRKSLSVLQETENLANNTLNTLVEQEEKIKSGRDKLSNTSVELSLSKKLINKLLSVFR